jgi:hypothetical protein
MREKSAAGGRLSAARLSGGGAMVLIRNGVLRVGEVWFDEEPGVPPPDIVRHRQRPRAGDGPGWRPFTTIVLDLTLPEATLLAGLKKDTQYAVRRATTKDGLVYRPADIAGPDDLEPFAGFYDAFAARKGLAPLDRTILRAYAAANVLDLSCVSDADGAPLVWHAYYRGTDRVRLLHSASHFRESDDSAYRAMLGRANRFHHWQDILRFKKEGITVYDLGGWYAGHEDEEKLRINKFKEEFGGTLVETYDGERALTWKGRLYRFVTSSVR